LIVLTKASKLQKSSLGRNNSNVILEMIGSGNFGRIDWVILGKAFI
jgi:hypothetical protein